MKSKTTSQSEIPPEFQETVIISHPDIQPKPVALPEPDPDAPQNYHATQLERNFFRNMVKKSSDRHKYRFEKIMISGGQGTILKVIDQDLQRVSAMKILLPKFKNNRETLKSFILEAKITGFLEHPNIIPIHEIGLLSNTGIYFTMKMANGQPLNEILLQLKENDATYTARYNMYRLLNIFRKVCDAVSFAHSKKIIHRDIKPHNIMVGEHGEVLLMDWGLARYIGDPETETDPICRQFIEDIIQLADNRDDRIKGSPAYMAPEMVSDSVKHLDEQSDIFLLGATLYHMCTLEPPYFGKDIVKVLQKAEHRKLIHPQKRAPDRQIPDELCRIILKAMAKDKSQRYASVEDLASDIDGLIAGKWSHQKKRQFRAGDMLMKEGETGTEAYMVLRGKVQVFKGTANHKIMLGTLSQGDIVGEMALISDGVRSASVQALEDTEVAILDKEIMEQYMAKMPTSISKIISTLSHRLRVANTRINPHATTDCTYHVLQLLRMIIRDQSDYHDRNHQISVDEICSEISEILSISENTVRTVLRWTQKHGLIQIEDNFVSIPDIDELAEFTRFGKIMSKIPLKDRKRINLTQKR